MNIENPKRVLWVLSHDFGEWSLARSFGKDQPFESRFLLPPNHPAESEINGDTIQSYATISDAVLELERFRPAVVGLGSGYLLAARRVLTPALVRCFVAFARSRGAAVMTTDPFLGVLQTDGARAFIPGLRGSPLATGLIEMANALCDVAHLFPARGPSLPFTPTFTFKPNVQPMETLSLDEPPAESEPTKNEGESAAVADESAAVAEQPVAEPSTVAPSAIEAEAAAVSSTPELDAVATPKSRATPPVAEVPVNLETPEGAETASGTESPDQAECAAPEATEAEPAVTQPAATQPPKLWLFVLSREDFQLQATIGIDKFSALLRSRAEDAVREARRATLIVPTEYRDAVAVATTGLEGVDVSGFVDAERYEQLLTEAEFVFFWNRLTNSQIQRWLRASPCFFFDRGHLAAAMPAVEAAAIDAYWGGYAFPLLDHNQPLVRETLKTLADEAWQAMEPARAAFAQGAAPGAIVDALCTGDARCAG